MQKIPDKYSTIRSALCSYLSIYRILAMILLVNIWGCDTLSSMTKVKTSPELPQHVVMVNGDGELISVTGNRVCPNNPEFKIYNKFYQGLIDYPRIKNDEKIEESLNCVLLGARKFIDKNNQQGKKSKILFFVHGGLNTQTETIETANRLYPKMNEARYYPIFINWQSSLFSSYFDHLFSIRQGRRAPWYEKILTTPFYLSYDLVRGAVKAPLTWYHMFKNDIESLPGQNESKVEIAADKWKSLYTPELINMAKTNGQDGPLAISEGEETRSFGEYTLSSLQYIVSLPFKLVIAPFLDAFGASAWDIMLRRTHTPFHKETEFTSETAGQVDDSPYGTGGLSQFFIEFEDLFCTDYQTHQGCTTSLDNVEITMIGHSAGTLIINQILRRFDLPIINLVYLASASTIRDYEKTVFPFLSKHTDTQFYHVLLHHDAEVRDRWDKFPKFIDLPPRGSLLVWIDNFLSKPQTFLDRTLGRWDNLVVALKNTPNELRERIHVKSFSVGDKFSSTDPQRHEDFKVKHDFWDPSFWKPALPP